MEFKYMKDLGEYDVVGIFEHYRIISNGREVITIPEETLTESETSYAVPIWDTKWNKKTNSIEAYIYGHYWCMGVFSSDKYHVYFESED